MSPCDGTTACLVPHRVLLFGWDGIFYRYVTVILSCQPKKIQHFQTPFDKSIKLLHFQKNLRVFLKRFIGPKFQREKTLHPQPLRSVATAGENKPRGEDDGRIAAGGSNGATCGETATIEITFAAYDAATRCCVFGTFFRTVKTTSPPKSRALKIYFFQLVPWNLKHPFIHIKRLFLTWMSFLVFLYHGKMVGNHYFHPLKTGSKWSFQVHIFPNDLGHGSNFPRNKLHRSKL